VAHTATDRLVPESKDRDRFLRRRFHASHWFRPSSNFSGRVARPRLGRARSSPSRNALAEGPTYAFGRDLR
jgi:hypothetical protein